MKKIICVTAAAMLLSLSSLANTSTVSPSSSVKNEEMTRTKSTTTTLPSGDKVHQDSTTIDSTKIEKQEEDSSMMNSSRNMNKKSGATTEPMDVDQD